jgi:hypothetical protein
MIKELGLTLLAPRVVLGVVWATIVGFGWWWLICHPPKQPGKPQPERYLAAHDMPENYRLGKSDLKAVDASIGESTLSQYLGRHLVRNVYQGNIVAITDLRAKPILAPSAGKDFLPFSIEGKPDLIETLNAGSRIDLYQNTECLQKAVLVLAIQCDPPATTNCKAILDLSESDKNALLKRESVKIIIFERKP